MKAFAKGALLGVALMGLVACGGGDDGGKKSSGNSGEQAPAAGEGGGGGGGGAQTYNAADHKGSLKGVVKFSGTAPEKVVFNVSSDAFCTGKWEGREPLDQKFEVNADGSVPHVFIYPKKGGPQDSYEGYTPPTGFVVTQHDCYYVPHVFGVMEGQEFTVQNDDQTMHNVNVKPKLADRINKGQAPGDKDVFSFKRKEKAIPFACDVHSWMSATCWVMDHPFFATSGADGSFEIKGLPDGKYTFVAWHENFKGSEFDVEISGGEATVEVSVSGN